MEHLVVSPPEAAGGPGKFVTTVFASWDRAGIDFLVLRNYDRLPDHIGNDLDVLVRGSHRHDAEALLRSSALDAGYRLHNRAEFSCVSLFFSNSSAHQIHIDLFTRLEWRGLELVPANLVLNHRIGRDFFSTPHPVHEAAINLLTRLLFHGYVKDQYRAQILSAFSSDSDLAIATLASAFGESLAGDVSRDVIAEKWNAIESSVQRLRLALLLRSLTEAPRSTLASLLRQILRLARRYVRPPGLFLVLLGPDGSGKSTVARNLTARLHSTFSQEKGSYVHWKPRLLGSGRTKQGPVTDPHAAAPRHPIASVIYFFLHLAEFALGGLLRVRPVLFRNGLVICDRYYHDFYVDLHRYRLSISTLLVRWGSLLVPTPDIVICLDAPSEVIRARKQEVPLRETIRQRAAFQRLAEEIPGARLIDASRPLCEVVGEAEGVVLEHLIARASQRAGDFTASTQR